MRSATLIGTPAPFQAQRDRRPERHLRFDVAKISKRARDLIARSYGIRLAERSRSRSANTAGINNGISITRRGIQPPQIVQFSQILPIRRNNAADELRWNRNSEDSKDSFRVRYESKLVDRLPRIFNKSRGKENCPKTRRKFFHSNKFLENHRRSTLGVEILFVIHEPVDRLRRSIIKLSSFHKTNQSLSLSLPSSERYYWCRWRRCMQIKTRDREGARANTSTYGGSARTSTLDTWVIALHRWCM